MALLTIRPTRTETTRPVVRKDTPVIASSNEAIDGRHLKRKRAGIGMDWVPCHGTRIPTGHEGETNRSGGLG